MDERDPHGVADALGGIVAAEEQEGAGRAVVAREEVRKLVACEHLRLQELAQEGLEK